MSELTDVMSDPACLERLDGAQWDNLLKLARAAKVLARLHGYAQERAVLDDIPPAGVKMANPNGDHAKFLKSGRWKDAIQSYLATCAYTDMNIGRLLDGLAASPRASNTIIVLWGDHGWQLGEHGFWCKHTNFEVASRTPLLIVAPGAEGGRVSRQLVEYVDIYPTLCDLAGLSQPKHLHGKSMRPLLVDVDAAHKNAVFTRHGGGDAVRTDRYRYMEMRSGGGKGELRGVGLFDLEKDAQENQNVAEQPAYAETRQRLQSMLDAVRAQSGS